MKKVILCTFIIIIAISFLACSFEPVEKIVMPYSCDEYENGEWTVDELVEHFEGLGFSDINVTNVMESFGEANVLIQNLTIEDPSSDAWYNRYRAFEKGEEFWSGRKIKIETHTYIPTLTVENCSDFAELIEMDEFSGKIEAVQSFMESHKNEYIEFEGTITDWYDEMHWVGVSFTVSAENSDYINFSWETTDLIDLKLEDDYHYTKYKTGLISAGMKVHMIAQIVYVDEEWHLEINVMEILN